jgi:CBS domain containing-hemolysin-like protein
MNSSLIIVLVSLLFSAFFSAIEIAFLSSNKLRIELDRKQGKRYTKIASLFLKRPGSFISTILMGNNITIVIYGIAMAKLCDPLIVSYVAAPGAVLLIETLISTFLILITCEWLPKTLARLNPNWILRRFAWLALLFYIILYPIAGFASLLSRVIIRLCGFKLEAKVHQTIFNKADLMNLSNEVSRAGEEENEFEHDIELFQNALEFSKVRVRECMIPRTEAAAIDERQTVNDLRQLFIKTGYSRVLVYSETIDKIIGYVHSKDLFTGMDTVTDRLRPIEFVPENMPAQNLLAAFIKNKKAVAVVVDEFGGTSGLVTMEDIFEEIFGEIHDEHDNEKLIEKQLSPTEFLFSGRVEIKNINKTYHLNIPEHDEYETLAGYIVHSNESIPQPHEILQFGHFRFRILRATVTKIDLVKLTLATE